MRVDVDDTNRIILGMLAENGRATYSEIAKSAGLSEQAVRRRVKIMLDGGAIRRFTVELGEEARATKAIVLASVESATETSRVSAKLAGLRGVKAVYEITGQYDIAVIMGAPSVAQINSGIDTLRKVEGVTDTNTVIILKTVAPADALRGAAPAEARGRGAARRPPAPSPQDRGHRAPWRKRRG